MAEKPVYRRSRHSPRHTIWSRTCFNTEAVESAGAERMYKQKAKCYPVILTVSCLRLPRQRRMVGCISLRIPRSHLRQFQALRPRLSK